MNERDDRDRLYADSRQPATEFVFDERVARVFPDMIGRSVPGYATVVSMTGVLASRYALENSNCYDLGCSLGATALSIRAGIRVPGCRIVAVDNSAAMLERAAGHIGQEDDRVPIELVQADILELEIVNASLVALNFILQFIPTERRLELLQRIHRGMLPGGVLVLSEKIAFTDPEEERHQIEMHHAFKRANGYVDLEISRKRTALEKVLIPETVNAHRTRLAEAGFSRTSLWFQCFNFVSLIAWR